MQSRGVKGLAAEFLGTFLLVLFVATVLSVFSTGGIGYQDFAVIGLVHVLVLASLIYTLGHASGAHFNPAVTAGMLVLRRIKPVDAAGYVVFQLCGGVLGALVTKALVTDAGRAGNYGTPQISEFLDGKASSGLVVEAIGTFLLVSVIAAVTASKHSENFAGIAIGFALGGVVMTMGPLAGASVNPARWFGPALVSGEWTNAWVYIVAPLIGGVLAALVFLGLKKAPEVEENEEYAA